MDRIKKMWEENHWEVIAFAALGAVVLEAAFAVRFLKANRNNEKSITNLLEAIHAAGMTVFFDENTDLLSVISADAVEALLEGE